MKRLPILWMRPLIQLRRWDKKQVGMRVVGWTFLAGDKLEEFLIWINRKLQITSTKLQINSKSQYPNLKYDQKPIVWDFEFRSL